VSIALRSAGRNALQTCTNYRPKGQEKKAYSNMTLREFECENHVDSSDFGVYPEQFMNACTAIKRMNKVG
jgi:hypothetical protein